MAGPTLTSGTPRTVAEIAVLGLTRALAAIHVALVIRALAAGAARAAWAGEAARTRCWTSPAIRV